MYVYDTRETMTGWAVVRVNLDTGHAEVWVSYYGPYERLDAQRDADTRNLRDRGYRL